MNNSSDVKDKTLQDDRKPFRDVLDTGGSTRSSSLSGYETQLPIDYHIQTAFLDTNNPESKKNVESISDRGIFPAEVSNPNSSACNTSLSW